MMLNTTFYNDCQIELKRVLDKFFYNNLDQLNEKISLLTIINFKKINTCFKISLDKLALLLYTYPMKVGICPPFVLLNDFMIYQTQLEANIYEISSSRLQALGYEIIRIRILNLKSEKTLQLMVERVDGANITLKDCEAVSRHLSVIFDVEDIISTNYHFEVSSAGLDSPLTRTKDFERNINNIIKVSTKAPINGQRKFTGKLINFIDNIVTLELSYVESTIAINFDMILESQLDYFATNTKVKGEKH